MAAASAVAADVMSRSQREKWSRHSDLNRGPAVYETAALPLSYVGRCADSGSASVNSRRLDDLSDDLWPLAGRLGELLSG